MALIDPAESGIILSNVFLWVNYYDFCYKMTERSEVVLFEICLSYR